VPSTLGAQNATNFARSSLETTLTTTESALSLAVNVAYPDEPREPPQAVHSAKLSPRECTSYVTDPPEPHPVTRTATTTAMTIEAPRYIGVRTYNLRGDSGTPAQASGLRLGDT
jgi:hypothetical protein